MVVSQVGGVTVGGGKGAGRVRLDVGVVGHLWKAGVSGGRVVGERVKEWRIQDSPRKEFWGRKEFGVSGSDRWVKKNLGGKVGYGMADKATGGRIIGKGEGAK